MKPLQKLSREQLQDAKPVYGAETLSNTPVGYIKDGMFIFMTRHHGQKEYWGIDADWLKQAAESVIPEKCPPVRRNDAIA